MEWWIILVVGALVLFSLFLTGMPLFVAFLTVNLGAVLLLTGERGFVLVSNSIFSTANISALSAIPLFILMGELLTRSGSVEMLFRAMDGLVGRIKGRQYVLTVLLSVVFGALSGAAMAVAAMMGRTLYPTMVQRRYNTRLSIGSIIAGASLAPIIPPSVLVVIVATLANVPVGGLLLAGIGPGLVAAALFLIYIGFRVRFDPSAMPEEDVGAKPEGDGPLYSLLLLLPFSIIIFCVVGLIMLGIASPSEAAGTGVVGSLAVAAVYRKLSVEVIWKALDGTVIVSTMILTILVSSNLFGQLLAMSGVTSNLVAFGTQLSDSPYVLLFLMLAIIFVMCMFIDQVALMLILVPIYQPLVDTLGFDPIWFWMLVLLNLTVGGITPPFGYTMFAFKGSAKDVPLSDVFAAAWPFVGLFLVLILLVASFPQIATFLPSIR